MVKTILKYVIANTMSIITISIFQYLQRDHSVKIMMIAKGGFVGTFNIFYIKIVSKLAGAAPPAQLHKDWFMLYRE